MKAFYQRGQIAMTMVLLVGGIAIAAGVGLSFIVASFVNSSYGAQAVQRASAAASAGTGDAMMRLVRNKDFASPSGYSFPIGTYSVSVTVTQNTPVSGQATIISQAIVANYKRKFRTVVQIEPITTEIIVISSQLVL